LTWRLDGVTRIEDGMEFAGKTVVITGAAGGLGSALVAAFAKAGARIVACDQSLALLEALEIPHKVAFDLTDRAGIAAAAQRIIAEAGTPDCLINNAGWTRGETLATVDDAVIGHEIDLNFTGVMQLTHALLPAMRQRGSGAIVFISSVNALAHFGNPAYAAAKAGLLAFSRAVAVECGGDGIRSNAVCPGSVRTPAWDHRIGRKPDLPEMLTRFYPLGRIVTPQEVAEAALFLASPRASGITGVALPVDAGLTAGNLPFFRDIIAG
jgi:NAD(P)-dependent dehydrogenase (short-subunit alcohol dehydrogenase family)